MKFSSAEEYYPPTVKLIGESPCETVAAFINKAACKNSIFIGLTLLDGTFIIENASEIADSLQIHEPLILEPEKGSVRSNPISVKRKNGDMLGYIPSSAAILPRRILNIGEELICRLECFEYSSGLLNIGVSLYRHINRF